MTRPPTHDHGLDSSPDERYNLIADYLRDLQLKLDQMIALLAEIRDNTAGKGKK